MTPAQSEQAVALYRERYMPVGIYEARIYPGMAPLLKALHDSGAHVALASSKPTFMLEKLCEHFGLSKYIDIISGVGLNRHSADKRDLLMGALPPGADVRRACMIGDRKFDIEAARKLGMTAVGVNYGYAPAGELAEAGADLVLDTVEALTDWILEGAKPRGKFITLEGSDGCGKSTQINLLREWLEARGWEVVLTREPGGCPISEKVRELLLSLDSAGMSAECEALLYAASRVEHVREVIKPALKLGKIVICDRFLDSSIAYQAFGRELGEAFVRQINAPALKDARPDVTLLLEVDRASAKKRMAKGAPPDRLESEQEDFFGRVQTGYDSLKFSEPDRVRPVDASRSIEDVFADVRGVVEGTLNRR